MAQTEVHVSLTHENGTDTDEPAVGFIDFVPTSRFDSGDSVVLPQAFRVELDEDGEATVFLTPNGAGWAWQAYERIPGGLCPRTFEVPESLLVVEYADLVDVDPKSLLPFQSSPQWALELAAEVARAEAAEADLQDQIDAVEAGDVDSVNGETGVVVVALNENPPGSFFYELETTS